MACSVSLNVCLPAANRMIALGRTIRAVAIVRRTVWTETGLDISADLIELIFGTHIVIFERCAFNRNKCVDGERFGVFRHADDQLTLVLLILLIDSLRDFVNQADPVFVLLTKTKDTTGANRDTSITNSINGRQSFIVRSGSDNGWVKLPRSVEIVVVCAQTGILQSYGLFRREHSQGSTDYHQHPPLMSR